MAKTKGTLGRIASKTAAVGREHVAKILEGAETLPEAAGAAVEDLLSGSKRRSARNTRVTAPEKKGSSIGKKLKSRTAAKKPRRKP